MDEEFEADLLERIQEGRPKRRPRPLRTALIAACVCLALVGTAVAAEQVFGIEISKLLTEDGRSTVELYSPSLTGYAVEEFSEDIQRFVAEADGQEEYYEFHRFDTFQDAKNFVGIPMPANALLDSTMDGNMGVHLMAYNGELSTVNMGAWFRVNGKLIDVEITHYADTTDPERIKSSFVTNQEYILSSDEYTMKNGETAVIVCWSTEEEKAVRWYRADFIQGGTWYEIMLSGDTGDSMDEPLQTLHQILDSFG